MGEASAGAQNLKNPITSGSKMMTAEGHTVYLLVDRQGAGGQGAVVGMLKVGRKKLFLLDTSGKPNEMSPMCVLDFYVTEKRQRTGCGQKLFETMLQREQVDPRYLAVDRPSDKLISFLRKHYGLANIIPQVEQHKIACMTALCSVVTYHLLTAASTWSLHRCTQCCEAPRVG